MSQSNKDKWLPSLRNPHRVRMAILLTVLASVRCNGDVGKIAGSDEDGSSLPVNFTIAFIGDQGYEPAGQFLGPRAVLRLIKEEGADAVLHQGDFDYQDNPAAWEEMINDVLGPDFPYFVAVGNHDVAEWGTDGGYRDRMERRMKRLGLSWDGKLGEESAFRYRGIYMIFGAPGVLGANPNVYTDYFEDGLSSDTSTWSICSWHKNQRLMQVGGKSDETGWGVYERCREQGAIIATAHEHSYSRTHLLSSMQNQVVASTSDTLVLRAGESFTFVSGLGGKSVRDQQLDGDWWAATYTLDQNATYGALFGVFNVDGKTNLAYFYFKDIDGNTADDFWVISRIR